MSLTAEFHLRSPQLPLGDVAAAVPDLTMEIKGSSQLESEKLVFVIRVTGSSFDGLAAALEESPIIEEYSLLSEMGAMRLYQLVTTVERPPPVEDMMRNEMFTESQTVLPDGWHVRQQFADREAFAEAREFCRTMDLSFHLDRLYESTTTDSDLIGLTDKQREALHTAYEAGYFAVPRRASMDDVATELDISTTALANRLHRAESHLIEHYVYSDSI